MALPTLDFEHCGGDCGVEITFNSDGSGVLLSKPEWDLASQGMEVVDQIENAFDWSITTDGKALLEFDSTSDSGGLSGEMLITQHVRYDDGVSELLVVGAGALEVGDLPSGFESEEGTSRFSTADLLDDAVFFGVYGTIDSNGPTETEVLTTTEMVSDPSAVMY